jgi:O-antigen/teichoic acid export membrane protein
MARRLLADTAILAVGMMAGNALSYGFSFALSHQLGPADYGQIGTLLSLFLIASIPATALQAVTARRIATAMAADGGVVGERVHAIAGPLLRRSVVVGAAEALLFLLLSPVISAVLPAISTSEVAWTAVSLLPFSVISGYFGLSQGSSRFRDFALMFIAVFGVKLVAGVAVSTTLASPTLVMGAVALAWLPTCAVCHCMLRDMVTVRTLIRGHGYLLELRRASWGMGVALLLSLLDGLLSAHYYKGPTLGSYQAGALFTRAGYFGPQFVGILVYPRLAVPETRKAALRVGVLASLAIGAFVTIVAALAARPLIDFAFGANYTDGSDFTLSRIAWIFALAGAMQSLVQLAQLDAVARGSSTVGWLVLCGTGVELLTIVTVAHNSPIQLITVAAVVATVTAVGGLVMAARAKHEEPVRVRGTEYLPAAS